MEFIQHQKSHAENISSNIKEISFLETK